MANKYVVEISYLTFEFKDRIEAIDFAETALGAAVDEGRTVVIKVVKEQEESQGDEE